MIYQALVTEETNGQHISTIRKLNTDDLPQGELLVKVEYSSLNYKDALSASGNKGVTKQYPHTPGIDAAGTIVESKSSAFEVGEKVIVTGFDLGMNTPGGFGEYIRVPALWAIKLPEKLSLRESMIYGTAGFTAGISVLKLTQQIKPSDGKIIVSGATGGVGSVAVAILNKLGYEVVAVSGKESEHDFLKGLGAKEIISRKTFLSSDDKAMFPGLYAGAIDTVGGDILVRIVKSLQPLGVVTTCGSVASTTLNLNVFPFILRAVSLLGVSAQNYPAAKRPELWHLLAEQWKPEMLENLSDEIGMNDLPEKINQILKGELKGRTLLQI
jgi:acrylyl-CoA reductase (NADPH)